MSNPASPANFSSFAASNRTSGNFSADDARLLREAWRFSKAFYTGVAVVDSLLAALIIAANVFLLAVLLSKPSLRNRLRNRLLVSLVASSLLVGVFGCPFSADIAVRRRWVHACSTQIVVVVLTLYVQNFVIAWGLTLLLINYLCRLKSYEGPAAMKRLPPRVQKCVAPVLLALLPWIVALPLTSSLIAIGVHQVALRRWTENWCPVFLETWAGIAMTVLNFGLPCALIVILLVAIVVVVRRQTLARTGSGTILGEPVVDDELDGQNPPLEPPWVHVTAGLLCVAVMACEEITKYALIRPRTLASWQMLVVIVETVTSVADLLTFVLALLWLLGLKDVRSRGREILAMIPIRSCKTSTSSEWAAGHPTSVTFRNLREEE